MRGSAVRIWAVLVGAGLVVAALVVVVAGRGGTTPRPQDPPPAAPAVATPAPSTEGTGDAATEPLPDRPNMVLVMADDMRVDDLAFAPNLRRLVAAHGVSFENSFSPFPLCCPARASFMTGQYAHNHKVLWHEPPFGYGSFDDSRTLATSMRQAGYRTGFVGKYLNRYGKDPSKVTGEPSYTYVPNGWDDWRGAVENPGDAPFHGDTYDYYDTPFNVNGVLDNRYRGVYQSKVIGDFSVDMVRSFARRPDPFFLYLNFVAPHHGAPNDHDEPGRILDRTGREVPIVTPAVPASVKGRFDSVVRRGSGVARTGERIERDRSDKPPAVRQRVFELGKPARDALRTATRRRAEAVWVMDQNIGRIIRALKRTGEWDRTVFMFTSDNGMLMGEHGYGMTKVWAYEPSLRVPLLVTGPGLREPQRRYDPVSTVDLTATILDLADAEAPHPADGQSRVVTLEKGDQGWSTPIVTESLRTAVGDDPAFKDRRSGIGIRVGRYSYTRYRDGGVELYDLVADPRQDTNVAGSPAYAEARAALDELWPRLKSCRADQCRPALPPVLAADPAANRQGTDTYWEAINAAYGW